MRSLGVFRQRPRATKVLHESAVKLDVCPMLVGQEFVDEAFMDELKQKLKKKSF